MSGLVLGYSCESGRCYSDAHCVCQSGATLWCVYCPASKCWNVSVVLLGVCCLMSLQILIWSSGTCVPFPSKSWALPVGRRGCSSKCFKLQDPLVVLSLPVVLQQWLIFTGGWTPFLLIESNSSLCPKTSAFESAVVSACFSFHERHNLSQMMLKREVSRTENSSRFLLQCFVYCVVHLLNRPRLLIQGGLILVQTTSLLVVG